jgi:hypothetical protein
MNITGYIGRRGDDGQTMTFVLLSFWTLKRRGDLMKQIERRREKKNYTKFETRFLKSFF